MKHLSLFIILATYILFSCDTENSKQTEISWKDKYTINESGNIYSSINVQGTNREFIMHLPQNFSTETQHPLILNFHGATVNGQIQMDYTNFNKLADEQSFVIIYPTALLGMIYGDSVTLWNTAPNGDVHFVEKLIDLAYNDFNIDLAKVYATGFSSGSFMSYSLACNLSNRIAAIATVSGPLEISVMNNCAMDYNVPIIHFHGTKDQNLPLEGVDNFALSVQSTLDFFKNKYGCQNATDMILLDDLVQTDSSTACYQIISGCGQNSEIQYYKIVNGGHTWPDALEAPHLGFTNRDINANKIIWNFFSKFSHPNPKTPKLE